MLKYLDLFAGAGGISLGMKAAGFSCVGVVEMDDRAAASYRLNFPDHTDEAALVRLGAAEGDARLPPFKRSGVINSFELYNATTVARAEC